MSEMREVTKPFTAFELGEDDAKHARAPRVGFCSKYAEGYKLELNRQIKASASYAKAHDQIKAAI